MFWKEKDGEDVFGKNGMELIFLEGKGQYSYFIMFAINTIK